MRSARGFLLGFLVLLFLGLSFNAYACLVPLYGAADATMGSGCSSPGFSAIPKRVIGLLIARATPLPSRTALSEAGVPSLQIRIFIACDRKTLCK